MAAEARELHRVGRAWPYDWCGIISPRASPQIAYPLVRENKSLLAVPLVARQRAGRPPHSPCLQCNAGGDPGTDQETSTAQRTLQGIAGMPNTIVVQPPWCAYVACVVLLSAGLPGAGLAYAVTQAAPSPVGPRLVRPPPPSDRARLCRHMGAAHGLNPPPSTPRTVSAGSCSTETFPQTYWVDWALAPIRSNVKTYEACCEACAANPACVRFTVWSSKPSPCRMFKTAAPLASLVAITGVEASTVLGSSQSERAAEGWLVLPRGAAHQESTATAALPEAGTTRCLALQTFHAPPSRRLQARLPTAPRPGALRLLLVRTLLALSLCVLRTVCCAHGSPALPPCPAHLPCPQAPAPPTSWRASTGQTGPAPSRD